MASDSNATQSLEAITREFVATAIQNDLGSEWELEEFQIKKVTDKGDNYASIVKSLVCTAKSKNVKKEVFYVVKLSQLLQIVALEKVFNQIFTRERVFFTDIGRKLNDILVSCGHSQITFPECVHWGYRNRQEIILSKDLRKRGFKMFDRKLGLDSEHSMLVMEELAKLHASSYILKKRFENKNILDIYPMLRNISTLEPGIDVMELLGPMIKGGISNSMKMIKMIEGYEKHYEWLKKLERNVIEVYVDLNNNCPKNMTMICHGDCWNNNLLFRYNDDGSPQNVALLDFQICRYTSAALDLNYFFYTSLSGSTRKKFYHHFISTYLQKFKEVLHAANLEMPFTEEEFKAEVKEKTLFGIINGLFVTQIILSENDALMDFTDIKEGAINEFVEGYSEKMASMIDTNPIFRDRFLSILNDALE